MAVIKSGSSTAQLEVNDTSKAARVTLYDNAGNPVLIPTNDDRHVEFTLTALNSTQSIDMDGLNGTAIIINTLGNAANRVVVEQAMDGTNNWSPCSIINALNHNVVAAIEATGTYTIGFLGGVSKIRARVSTYTSGSITGELTASYANANQNVIRAYDNVYSVVNSTTGQLASSASFTGAWEADLTWQGVTMSIFSDQDMLVKFQQSNDGITVHNEDSFRYRAGLTNNFSSFAINLINNYHRVVIQNVGSGTSTTFFYNLYECPNFTAEPRALTPAGNKKVEVPIKDTYRACFTGTPVATLTFAIKSTSTTRTVRITKIGFSQSGTSTAYIDVTVKRYSAIATGTPVTITPAIIDNPNGGSIVAAVYNYTVTPGTQTVAGVIDCRRYMVNKSADNVAPQYYELVLGDSQRGTGAATIRNTTDYIGIDISALTAGSAANMFIEWCED